MRAGDEAGFTRLYKRHYDAILSYGRRRTDEQTARAVAAEVFVVAWRRADQVPDKEALPWLYGVAPRVLANAQRGERSRDRLALRAGIAEVPSAHPDPSERVNERHRVAGAMARLSQRDQETLQLIAWEDLDVAAAAQVVGCSTAAFAVRLHPGRRRRRQHRCVAGPGRTGDHAPDPGHTDRSSWAARRW